MNKKKTMTALIIVLAVLFIGIGYAAISNVTLNITGNAKVEPSSFDVNYVHAAGQDPSTTAFAGTASGFTPDIAKTYAKYTGKKTAIISATEFTKKDQYVDFTFTVQNDSEDLNATVTSADISIPAGNTYLSAELVGTVNLNLAPQATGEFTVRVKCLKTPTEEQKWENFVITITAKPAETTGA